MSLFRSTWGALYPFSTRISRQRECSFVRVNIVYTPESGSWLIFREIKKCLLSLRLWEENWFTESDRHYGEQMLVITTII